MFIIVHILISAVLLQVSDMENTRPVAWSYLKRDQITYELRIRECSQEGSMPELIARLRASAAAPVVVSPSSIGEVGDAIASCAKGLQQLSEAIEFLVESTPSRRQLSRVRAQLNHYSFRVGDLQQLKLDKEQGVLVVKLKEKLQKLLVDVNSVALEGESDDDVRDLPPGGKRGEQGEGNVTISNSGKEFAKLPHPLGLLFREIKELSVDNLNEIQKLLWLTVRFEKHATALQVAPYTVLAMWYPLAKGRLTEFIGDVLKLQGTLKDLRQRIIGEKIPTRVLRELERLHFWQSQYTDETLTDYVDRVKTARIALQMDISEEEVVSTIVEGLRPEDRARAIFNVKPLSFEQLDHLINSIGGLKLIDDQRVSNLNSELRVRVPRRQGLDPDHGKINEAKVRGQCFGCGATDHFVRVCPVRPTKGNDS